MADEITPNMGLTSPDIGGDPGTWGTLINANNVIVDDHNHAAGNGVLVPAAGLDIDDDLDFQSHLIENITGAIFTTSASPGNHSVWVKTSTGDLYYTNGSGAQVQVTSGSTINVSVVGGITGDYASVSASFYYDDSGKTYRALQAAPLPNNWASLSVGDIDIYPKTSGATHYTRLSAHAALGANYTLTLPDVLPANDSLVVTSDAGEMTFSRDITIDTILANGAITAATLHFTTTRTLAIGATLAKLPAIAGYSNNDQNTIALGTAANPVVYPIALSTGDEITGVNVRVNKATDATKTLTVTLRKLDKTTGTTSTIGTASNSANAPGVVSISIGSLTEMIDEDADYTINLTPSGTTGDVAYGANALYHAP